MWPSESMEETSQVVRPHDFVKYQERVIIYLTDQAVSRTLNT